MFTRRTHHNESFSKHHNPSFDKHRAGKSTSSKQKRSFRDHGAAVKKLDIHAPKKPDHSPPVGRYACPLLSFLLILFPTPPTHSLTHNPAPSPPPLSPSASAPTNASSPPTKTSSLTPPSSPPSAAASSSNPPQNGSPSPTKAPRSFPRCWNTSTKATTTLDYCTTSVEVSGSSRTRNRWSNRQCSVLLRVRQY